MLALEGTDGVGASAGSSGTSGAPHVALTTTDDASLVFALAAGGSASARTLPFGWFPLTRIPLGTGEAAWVPYTNQAVAEGGTVVHVVDHGSHQPWNVVAVEMGGDGS
ncbi:MAG TPA: hypothetical protein VLZ77_02205 [Acidimicrobiales bacterium]|nr:hypothetical protein [Acidimicrobiales bacterium]